MLRLVDMTFLMLQATDSLVVERREDRSASLASPVTMNAFELISKSRGLNLATLFEKQMVGYGLSFSPNILSCNIDTSLGRSIWCLFHVEIIYECKLNTCADLIEFYGEQGIIKRETRFTSNCPADEIISKIKNTAVPLGFDVKINNFKVSFSC